MGIEGLAQLGVQLGHHLARVLVEQIDEALQHVQMESGRNQLAMRSPLVTWERSMDGFILNRVISHRITKIKEKTNTYRY